jgi:hypothetical protein
MKTNYSSFTVTFFIAMICLLSVDFTTAQDWYDMDWQYRREVTLNNTAGEFPSKYNS